MRIIKCPSCGVELQVISPIAACVTCTHCHASSAILDNRLESIGQSAILKDDSSPLQIGTAGDFEGTGFSVVGRVRMLWESGNWNEWFLFCADGRERWLTEAQGHYAVYWPVTQPFSADDLQTILPGATRRIGKLEYCARDVKRCSVDYIEGELPKPVRIGTQYVSVDFYGPEDETATVQGHDGEVNAFAGRYQDFPRFRFDRLRSIHGW